jgi:hypothetical protein
MPGQKKEVKVAKLMISFSLYPFYHYTLVFYLFLIYISGIFLLSLRKLKKETKRNTLERDESKKLLKTKKYRV